MEFHLSTLQARKKGDLLVAPFWKEKEKVAAASPEVAHFEKVITAPRQCGDFKGKEGELLFVYLEHEPEKRFALLGLGEKDKITIENLRRAYAALTKAATGRKLQTLNLMVPHIPGLTEEDVLRGMLEGLLLANYSFTKHKHDSIKDNPPVLLSSVTLIGAHKGALAQAKEILQVCEAVYFARDLVNTNADEMNPIQLGEVAKELAKANPKLKVTLFDKKKIEKEKLGLLLAVNRGSHQEPRMIIIEYKGKPKSSDLTALVGKGITYDTGGLNLKTTGMETMRCDMGGAALVLGTMKAVADLKLPVNLVAIIPATENSISSSSYKPGDVYVGYAGISVEIGNTDAEGRLVLADALAYVEKNYKPTRIIDFATLTGGIDIALGSEATGIMSNNDALADQLILAGSETFERLWRLPLFDEYKEGLKSDVADMRNIATRAASSIIGATFLRAFIKKKTPWAHLDIASTAFLSEAKRYNPKLGTGVGVRLMVEFLKNAG